jgi:NhaA family Na+:H+ antiporter
MERLSAPGSEAESVDRFVDVEVLSGVVLMLAALIALAWANSPWAPLYQQLWHRQLTLGHGGLTFAKPLQFWINDGLMIFFFLLVGLEIRRELHQGALSDRRVALLPVIAASGGVLIPALIYLGWNLRHPALWRGWAIPTATDIAFATAVLALLGRRVPRALRAFLLAIAVIDDIAAIVIIAVAYSAHFDPVRLLATHPALMGIVLGLLVPVRKGQRLERGLHPWVAFGVMPLFAFANAGVSISGVTASLQGSGSLLWGVATGLVIGKPLGITLLTRLSVLTGCCRLPPDVDFRSVFVVGCMAGTGFTMSVFICHLAFEAQLLAISKLAVLVGTGIAGAGGLMIGRTVLRPA